MAYNTESSDIMVTGGNAAWPTTFSPFQIALQNLLSSAADVTDAAEIKALILDSNETASAWLNMAHDHETTIRVQRNYRLLKQVADYYRSNPVLSDPATYSGRTKAFVDQWVAVTPAVRRPISRVQDVNETTTTNLLRCRPSAFLTIKSATVKVTQMPCNA